MDSCSVDLRVSAPTQVDNKGRNFLHVAVQNSDIESVLFLISVQANVNSRVQDAAKLTPLHLAVQAGSEIIVRNLVNSPRSPGSCALIVSFRRSAAAHAVFVVRVSTSSCWPEPK